MEPQHTAASQGTMGRAEDGKGWEWEKSVGKHHTERLYQDSWSGAEPAMPMEESFPSEQVICRPWLGLAGREAA